MEPTQDVWTMGLRRMDYEGIRRHGYCEHEGVMNSGALDQEILTVLKVHQGIVYNSSRKANSCLQDRLRLGDLKKTR